ncbi:uncharacterized protein [Pleurodeles waltl]|uniref:uncharacterized protein n=1 Tax=Pleurodeles waltl TaxID=8319 RepID=UPI00370985E1
MSNSKKKVTFNQRPIYVGAREGKVGNNRHTQILQHNYAYIVKSLPLSGLLYRRLNETGVLTTDQIGEIELEDSTERKVAKLLEILKKGDQHMFASFCDVLHEEGFQHLAQTLITEITRQVPSFSTGQSLPYQKQNLKEVVLAHNEHEWALKEENMRLRQRIQYLKSKYQHNLKQLEEQIAFVRWQRDLALNEHEARRRENEELQSLNRELRALVTRLEGTAESRVTVTDLGLSVDFLPGSAHAPQRRTHLALMFR